LKKKRKIATGKPRKRVKKKVEWQGRKKANAERLKASLWEGLEEGK